MAIHPCYYEFPKKHIASIIAIRETGCYPVQAYKLRFRCYIFAVAAFFVKLLKRDFVKVFPRVLTMFCHILLYDPEAQKVTYLPGKPLGQAFNKWGAFAVAPAVQEYWTGPDRHFCKSRAPVFEVFPFPCRRAIVYLSRTAHHRGFV